MLPALLVIAVCAAPLHAQDLNAWLPSACQSAGDAGSTGSYRSPWTGAADEEEASEGDEGEENQGGGQGGQKGGAAKGWQSLPAPLAPFVEPLNPARLQLLFDEALGLDTSKWSNKPRAPEIPLAVYRETIRPIAALKYENQPSYFIGSFSGKTPTIQLFSYDYVFADWQAVRFEYRWDNGAPESFLFGYQRTLGVGPRHNWTHAITFLPEYVIPERFVGGSAIYTFAWKPYEKSPWTITPTLGVNRVDQTVETDATASLGRLLGLTGASGGGRMEHVKGIWRPQAALNFFYTFAPALTVGIENDILPSGQKGEYLVLPFVTWRPTQHFFIQTGGGYYQVGSDSQFTFMCRVNLLFPTPRQSR